MQNLERIDNYFNEKTSDEEKRSFEQQIATDPAFAEEVAFYINAKAAVTQQLKQEKTTRFKELYQEQKDIPVIKKAPVKKMWLYMAAACVAVAVFLIPVFMNSKNSPDQLANTYIEKELKDIGVQMSATQDSLQQGLDLYNNGKAQEALLIFETMLRYQPANNDAEKYAGIACLHLEKYDMALQHFAILANDTALFSNPGTFYQAITFMKRNKPGDAANAKQLLQEVKDKNLEGAAVAEEWLQKLK